MKEHLFGFMEKWEMGYAPTSWKADIVGTMDRLPARAPKSSHPKASHSSFTIRCSKQRDLTWHPLLLTLKTTWLTGLAFLTLSDQIPCSAETFDLMSPSEDVDVHREIMALTITAKDLHIGSHLGVEGFSIWKSILRSIGCLIHVACSFKEESGSYIRWIRSMAP